MRHRTHTSSRALRWAALAGWMVVIFLLSAQPGEESSALSGVVMQAVIAVLDWSARLFGAEAFPAGGLGVLHLLVRKAAHITAYAVLGALALWALAPRVPTAPAPAPRSGDPVDEAGDGVVEFERWVLALLVSVGYAATDEFHQTFVPGRGGEVTDVLIDAVGALAGILLLLLWWRRRPRAVRR